MPKISKYFVKPDEEIYRAVKGACYRGESQHRKQQCEVEVSVAGGGAKPRLSELVEKHKGGCRSAGNSCSKEDKLNKKSTE